MHKTDNLEDGYMGSGKLIQRSINKYGVENFSKEILHIFDNEEDMKNKEKELVVVSEETYNLCPGGKGGFGYINENKLWNTDNHLKASKSNLIKANEKYKELIKNESYREQNRFLIKEGMKKFYEKNDSPWLNKKHKPETIEKLKGHSRQKGDKNSQYGTCWITDGKENKKIKEKDFEFWKVSGYYKGRIV